MNATRIVPGIPLSGLVMPSIPNTQPPTKAPQIPIMMSPMIPSPVPPITNDARRPATSPTIIQVRKSMLSIRDEVRWPVSNRGQSIALDQTRPYFTSRRAASNPYESVF